MALSTSREYALLLLLVCAAVLALPVSIFAECWVVEHPDHNEVVCDDDVPTQVGQSRRKEASKLETTSQKEFVFYSPVNPITKLTISADLSPFGIASPGDTLLSYRADVLKDKVYTPTTASFVYEERTEDATFTIREEGTGERAGAAKVTSVTFNDKRSLLLLIPFRSGCSSDAVDGVYLKMKSIDGSQLHYQLIIPPCLSKLLEKSISE